MTDLTLDQWGVLREVAAGRIRLSAAGVPTRQDDGGRAGLHKRVAAKTIGFLVGEGLVDVPAAGGDYELTVDGRARLTLPRTAASR